MFRLFGLKTRGQRANWIRKVQVGHPFNAAIYLSQFSVVADVLLTPSSPLPLPRASAVLIKRAAERERRTKWTSYYFWVTRLVSEMLSFRCYRNEKREDISWLFKVIASNRETFTFDKKESWQYENIRSTWIYKLSSARMPLFFHDFQPFFLINYYEYTKNIIDNR